MQEIKLNIVPGGVIPVIHATQYDVGRELKFLIFDGNSPASLTGTTATIEGTKPDGNGFSYECTISNNEVTVETTAQMTVLSGSIDCKITFFKESDRIGTALFILDIEKAALNSDTPISDTDIPTIIALAREQEQNAEAWANGTRGGEPTEPTDPTYHKDSRYWAEYAESAVTGVTGVKGNTETDYRRGNVNLTPANIGALATDGDSKDNTVTFTSSDNDATTEKTSDGFTSVATMASGESHASLFQKISKMFLNIRKLWNTVGETELDTTYGQTITAQLANLNTKIFEPDVLWTGEVSCGDTDSNTTITLSSSYRNYKRLLFYVNVGVGTPVLHRRPQVFQYYTELIDYIRDNPTVSGAGQPYSQCWGFGDSIDYCDIVSSTTDTSIYIEYKLMKITKIVGLKY